MLDSSYFFLQDTLRTYATSLNNASSIGYGNGTLPYVQFNLNKVDSIEYGGNYFKPFTLTCAADPVTFNNYQPGVGSTLNYCPNLDMIVSLGGQYHIYPTLNVMEMVYDRIYMMQIQYAFNTVPN
jgi:hypothetical protein